MAHGAPVREGVQKLAELPRRGRIGRAPLAQDEVAHPGDALVGVLAHAVELQAVARAQHHGAGEPGGRLHILHAQLVLRVVHAQLLKNLKGCALDAQPHDDGMHSPAPVSSPSRPLPSRRA